MSAEPPFIPNNELAMTLKVLDIAGAEIDRLRALIDDIADMDLGEPEMEHREIIARCRQEQKRWTEAVE